MVPGGIFFLHIYLFCLFASLLPLLPVSFQGRSVCPGGVLPSTVQFSAFDPVSISHIPPRFGRGFFVPVCCSFILIMDLVRGFPHSLVLLLPFTAARTPAFQVTRWKYFTFSLHKAAILVSVSLSVFLSAACVCFVLLRLFCFVQNQSCTLMQQTRGYAVVGRKGDVEGCTLPPRPR